MIDSADGIRILVRPQPATQQQPVTEEVPVETPNLEMASPDKDREKTSKTSVEPEIEVKRILMRPRPTNTNETSASKGAAPELKTFQEREEDYAKARERIFKDSPAQVCTAFILSQRMSFRACWFNLCTTTADARCKMPVRSSLVAPVQSVCTARIPGTTSD